MILNNNITQNCQKCNLIYEKKCRTFEFNEISDIFLGKYPVQCRLESIKCRSDFFLVFELKNINMSFIEQKPFLNNK